VIEMTPAILEAMMRRRASVAADWPGRADVAERAARHGFVPLYADLGGVVGVRPDGTFVGLGDDPDAAPAEMTSVRWRDLAVLIGAKRYPELRALIPPRPPDAVTCANCAGSGVIAELPTVTCACGGLGWIPPDWEPFPAR
jgi:hypothetical protein